MQLEIAQVDLASQITVSRQAISKWENDESIPDIENLIQISKIFNVSLDYLLDKNSDKEPDISFVEIDKKKKKFLWILICLVFIFIALFIGQRINAYITTMLWIILIIGIAIFIKLICFLINVTKKNN